MKIKKELIKKLPIHAKNWRINKIVVTENSETYSYPHQYLHSSKHQIEFFYKPILRITIFENEK